LGGGLNGRILIGHDLFENIISLENLFLAWKEFKRGKMGKHDVQEFALSLEDNLFYLNSQLRNLSYRHSAYSSFYVSDPKLRHIHKACVRDRVLHHAVFRVLCPIFEKDFIFDSYSCRVGKGTHRAISRLANFLNKASQNDSKNIFVVKLDVRKFFDSVSHNILMAIIRRRINETRITWLLNEIIVESYSKENGLGLPIGNVTSQLFANIYLNELDQFVKHNLKKELYIRYCDDFILVARTPEELKGFISDTKEFLRDRLGLDLHKDKIIIRKYRQGIDFLGYVALPHCRVLRTKTKRRILGNVARNGQNQKSIQSYLGLLSHGNTHKIKTKLMNLIESSSS